MAVFVVAIMLRALLSPVDAQVAQRRPAGGGWKFSYQTATGGDAAVKTSAGILHSVTIDDVATTAGNVVLENSTDGSGTDTILNIYIDDAATFTPRTLILDVAFDTGLYVDFDGTLAGASISIAYF
jgi:hypothetical protein